MELEQERSVLNFANAAGIAQSGLAEIKQGQNKNVTFSTLARFAYARGKNLSAVFREIEQEEKRKSCL